LNSQQFIIDFHENGKKNQNNSLYWILILHFCFMRSKSKKRAYVVGRNRKKKLRSNVNLFMSLVLALVNIKK